MATPERRTAPGTPALPTGSAAPAGPVPVVAPFGWLVILFAGIGLVLATWLVYGTGADGMWAGYRDGFIGTIVIICAMALNTSVSRQPVLALVGLAGILLVLFGVFIDDGQAVMIAELVAGAAMIVGAGLYGSGRRG